MAKILVIDDDVEIRRVIRRELEHHGHEVTEADDGASGVRVYHDCPSDLVITDIIMPEKDGLELMIELRRQYPELKFIAISGGGRHALLDYLPAAERLGATRCVKKPISAVEFVNIVHEVLDGEAPPPFPAS